MKKSIIGLLITLSLCGVASARTVDIAQWDFTAPDGSSLTNALDNINGYYFQDHGGMSISNNAMHVVAFTNSAYSTIAIDTISSGKVKMNWDVLPSMVAGGGQVTFGFKNPAKDVSMANLRFDSNGTQLRLSAYIRKPDNSGNKWVYVAFLGGVELTEVLHLSLEYDVITGKINWSWSGYKSGSKTFDGLVSPVGFIELQSKLDTLKETDHIELDNLHVEHVLPPMGALVQDLASLAATNSALYTLGTFDATNGDYVVVIATSNEGENPTETSVNFTGSTGTMTYQIVTGNGPSASAWYAPVTSNGTVTTTYQATDAPANQHIVASYLIRSTTGELEAPVFVSETTEGGPTSAQLAYTVPSETDGVFLEAFSAYSGASPDNTDTIVDANQWMQRAVAHGTFSGKTELTNTWTIGTSAHSLLGILFTGVQTESPEQVLYNEWVANYPSLGTDIAMTDNPDGDLLDNLAEYAFGGDPTDASDQGYAPEKSIVSTGGMNYLHYIYARHSNYADRGLIYSIEINDDLAYGTWTNSGYTVEGVGENVFGSGFDAVTNQIPIDLSEKFMRSKVEFLKH